MATPPDPAPTERTQLGRDVLPTAGGGNADAVQPWKAVTPSDALERMDRLLQLVEDCAGSVQNFRSDLAEHARYRPFVLTSRLAQPSFYALCRDHVIPAWFIGQERLSSDHLRRFYNGVLGEGHCLPYVDVPEGRTAPVSWFRSVGNGFWRSMRPPEDYVPLFIQDAASGSALYGRPRLPSLHVYRPRRAVLGYADPLLPRSHAGRGELAQLLLLVRQMGGERGDALVTEAVRTHVKRIARRIRRGSDDAGRDGDGSGIPVSLYRED